MLGLLEVPRIRLKDYEMKLNVTVDNLLQDIPETAYSFIVDRASLPDRHYRIEAYPFYNECGNPEELIVFAGSFIECMDKFNEIADTLRENDVEYNSEMMDFDYIRYAYFFSERVRSKLDSH